MKWPLFLILTSLYGSNLIAQDQFQVDIFREAKVLRSRAQVEVKASNPSENWIFCEVIRSPVFFRSKYAAQPWQEVIVSQGVWLPPQMDRIFRTGLSKTNGLRNSGVYPDAFIDTVDNSLLSLNSNCSYKQPEGNPEISESFDGDSAPFTTGIGLDYYGSYMATTITDGNRHLRAGIKSRDNRGAAAVFLQNPGTTFDLSQYTKLRFKAKASKAVTAEVHFAGLGGREGDPGLINLTSEFVSFELDMFDLIGRRRKGEYFDLREVEMLVLEVLGSGDADFLIDIDDIQLVSR
ncbi:MAG: hypothetical protein EOP04_08000 [Proteobacteria bacterium]|nr:MAG: hypothetical protein EOP04_08000 [Pseudomonadota bacterium]